MFNIENTISRSDFLTSYITVCHRDVSTYKISYMRTSNRSRVRTCSGLDVGTNFDWLLTQLHSTAELGRSLLHVTIFFFNSILHVTIFSSSLLQVTLFPVYSPMWHIFQFTPTCVTMFSYHSSVFHIFFRSLSSMFPTYFRSLFRIFTFLTLSIRAVILMRTSRLLSRWGELSRWRNAGPYICVFLSIYFLFVYESEAAISLISREGGSTQLRRARRLS